MIQFYDDKPDDPLTAFVWFEQVFRRQFLGDSSPWEGGPLNWTCLDWMYKDRPLDGMREFVMRLLIVKHELSTDRDVGETIMPGVLPYWDFWAYSYDEFDKQLYARVGSYFDEAIFRLFEKDLALFHQELRRSRNV